MEARWSPCWARSSREAGKTLATPSARCARRSISCATMRRSIDGLSNDTHQPLGVVACISPWNFPLSIFTGQIAGALAAGNAVIAKPAEETPLIAALAVALLHEAGVPPARCSCCPATARSARALVGNPRVAGVVFTGSTEVARRSISAARPTPVPDGRPLR